MIYFILLMRFIFLFSGTVYLRDIDPFVQLTVSADVAIDGQPAALRCRGDLAVADTPDKLGTLYKFAVSESDPYVFRIGVSHQGIHITQAVALLTIDPSRNALNGTFGGSAVLDTVQVRERALLLPTL